MLSEHTLDNGVVSEGNARTADLAVAALVDKLTDDRLGRIAIGHIGLNSSDHVHRRLVQADEDTVVELSQAEQAEDLLASGVELVDTIRLIIFCGYILNNKSWRTTSLIYA